MPTQFDRTGNLQCDAIAQLARTALDNGIQVMMHGNPRNLAWRTMDSVSARSTSSTMRTRKDSERMIAEDPAPLKYTSALLRCY